jgi:hypothetical protein
MKYLILLLTLLGFIEAAPPTKADDITYDFLVQTGTETGYCDHIAHIRKILETTKVKVLLEFGLGYSTKYFLDNCAKVISVEFVQGKINPDWMKHCLDLYKGYSNWIPVAYFSNFSGDFSFAPYKYFASHKLFEAEATFAATGQASGDDAHVAELKTFIGNITKFNKVDLALVDPSILERGVLVQLLFEKSPIILAHDCYSFVSAELPDTYGYRKVIPPEDYETIFISKGKGTLLWIKKTDPMAELIRVMKDYAASL